MQMSGAAASAAIKKQRLLQKKPLHLFTFRYSLKTDCQLQAAVAAFAAIGVMTKATI